MLPQNHENNTAVYAVIKHYYSFWTNCSIAVGQFHEIQV